MRFESNKKFNDDDTWFDVSIRAEYNKLSEEDKAKVDKWLDGETDRIVDPKKFKKFLTNIASIRKFFEEHSSWYNLNVDQNTGIVHILFDSLLFDSPCDFFSLFSDAKNITIEAAITRENHAEIEAEFDIISEFR